VGLPAADSSEPRSIHHLLLPPFRRFLFQFSFRPGEFSFLRFGLFFPTRVVLSLFPFFSPFWVPAELETHDPPFFMKDFLFLGPRMLANWPISNMLDHTKRLISGFTLHQTRFHSLPRGCGVHYELSSPFLFYAESPPPITLISFPP